MVRFGWWLERDDTMPYTSKETDFQNSKDKTNLWDNVSIKESNNSIINRLLKEFWLGNIDWDHKFLSYARAIINMALWLVAFIALIMTLYTFYTMFFSENETWIKKAKWNLIGIFIALAVLWLAWIIVSFIFRRYQSNWKDNEENILTKNVIYLNYTDTIDNQIYLTI